MTRPRPDLRPSRAFEPKPLPDTLSHEQRPLLEELVYTRNHVVCGSTAGSGKSTITRMTVERLDPKTRTVLFAYSKSIVREQSAMMRAYARPTLMVSTTHAYGKRVLQRHATHVLGRGNLKPEDGKYTRLALAYLTAQGVQSETLREEAQALGKLCDMAMDTLAPATEAGLEAVCGKFGLTTTSGLSLPDAVRSLIHTGQQEFYDTGKISFAEMLYLPVKLKLTSPEHLSPEDAVDDALLDEAQDASKLQLRFIRSLVVGRPGARIAALGDEHQCIYGFNGADPSGMRSLVEDLGAKPFELTVSYRCPAAVVNVARQYSPQIRARDNAPEGLVLDIDELDVPRLAHPGDLIIARHNIDVVRMALRLVGLNIPVTMLGGPLHDDLKKLSANVLGGLEWSPQEAAFHTERYAEQELLRLWNAGTRGERLTKDTQKLSGMLACLTALAVRAAQNEGGSADNGHVTRLIDALFQEDGGVFVGTVHASKGRQARQVFILNPEAMPVPTSDPVEENNILFVGTSRATHVMFFVHTSFYISQTQANGSTPGSVAPAAPAVQPPVQPPVPNDDASAPSFRTLN